jgi:serine/threonine protein phosphatase 1
MTATLTRITRCVRLPRNNQGRDLVVGDLHGHRVLLERELEQVHFDPAIDRVISVGDLINRGPDSLETLSLIEEPWFHAVLGNHELMLLNFLGYYSSRIHCGKSFPTGGGSWINDAWSGNRKTVRRLADKIAALPLAINVEADCVFNVMHGDWEGFNDRPESSESHEAVTVHEADRSTSSRANFREAMRSTLINLRFADHVVQTSERAMGDLHMTYVGHSPVRNVTVHNSYIYIDRGVCGRPVCAHDVQRPPTLLDHAQFSRWLTGVETARGLSLSRA